MSWNVSEPLANSISLDNTPAFCDYDCSSVIVQAPALPSKKIVNIGLGDEISIKLLPVRALLCSEHF